MTNRENPIHRIKSYLGSGSGSMITDTDPRIRIRIQIKMIWIRNTASNNSLFLFRRVDEGKNDEDRPTDIAASIQV